MDKKPHSNRFRLHLDVLAWRISWPHISTSENLHANQKPVFSIVLREYLEHFFDRMQTLRIYQRETLM